MSLYLQWYLTKYMYFQSSAVLLSGESLTAEDLIVTKLLWLILIKQLITMVQL